MFVFFGHIAALLLTAALPLSAGVEGYAFAATDWLTPNFFAAILGGLTVYVTFFTRYGTMALSAYRAFVTVDVQAEINSIRDELAKTEKRLRETEQQLKEEKESNRELTEKIAALQEEIKTLRLKISKLIGDNDYYKQELSKKNQALKTAAKYQAKSDRRINELEAINKRQAARILDLEKQISADEK